MHVGLRYHHTRKKIMGDELHVEKISTCKKAVISLTKTLTGEKTVRVHMRLLLKVEKKDLQYTAASKTLYSRTEVKSTIRTAKNTKARGFRKHNTRSSNSDFIARSVTCTTFK